MCMLILKRAYLLRSFHSQINDLIQLPLTKIKDGKSTWAHKWLRTWVTTINKLMVHEPNLDVAALVGPWVHQLVEYSHLSQGICSDCPSPGWPCWVRPEVNDHNSRNSKSGQLLSQKAQSVRNIMQHFDKEAREALIAYTIEIGHENTGWTDDNLSSKKILPGFQLFGRIHRNQAVNFGYRWAIHPPFFPILFCLKPTSKCIDPVPCSMPCSMPNLQTCPGSSAMRVLYGKLVARSPRRAIGWWHLLSTIRGLDSVICSK